jgi:hypothetical protein
VVSALIVFQTAPSGTFSQRTLPNSGWKSFPEITPVVSIVPCTHNVPCAVKP